LAVDSRLLDDEHRADALAVDLAIQQRFAPHRSA